MKNLLSISMTCFLGIEVEQKTIDYNWSQVRILGETAIFSYNFLFLGYFCSSKCPGPAVANFELMINSLMMNRVKGFF